MVIEVKQIEATYIPKYFWMKGSRIEGVAEWMEEDEDDETELVLDPSGNKINISSKKLKDIDALGLSVRRTT